MVPLFRSETIIPQQDLQRKAFPNAKHDARAGAVYFFHRAFR